jgi:hypothetical protein
MKQVIKESEINVVNIAATFEPKILHIIAKNYRIRYNCKIIW